MKPHPRATAAVLALLIMGTGCGPAPEPYDVVIRGGTVIDGTGDPPRAADVAIRGDRIVAVGEVDGEGTLTIDAAGRYVTPGFIDSHSHSETERLVDGRGPSFSLQGITTEVFGETFSMGPVGGRWDGPSMPAGIERDWTTLGGFLESLERRGTAANFGSPRGYRGGPCLRARLRGPAAYGRGAGRDEAPRQGGDGGGGVGHLQRHELRPQHLHVHGRAGGARPGSRAGGGNVCHPRSHHERRGSRGHPGGGSDSRADRDSGPFLPSELGGLDVGPGVSRHHPGGPGTRARDHG